MKKSKNIAFEILENRALLASMHCGEEPCTADSESNTVQEILAQLHQLKDEISRLTKENTDQSAAIHNLEQQHAAHAKQTNHNNSGKRPEKR